MFNIIFVACFLQGILAHDWKVIEIDIKREEIDHDLYKTQLLGDDDIELDQQPVTYNLKNIKNA